MQSFAAAAALFLLAGFSESCKNGPTDDNIGDIVLVPEGTDLTAIDSLPLRSDTADRILEITPPTLAPPPRDTIASEQDLPAKGQWTEITNLDPTIRLDLRYATTDNFVEEQMYACARCFLRPAAARSLVAIHASLKDEGLGLKLYDCYRPLDIQWRLWNKVPDRRYVADPRKGSQHNRGVAVDLTLVDLVTGEELDMGTDYDFFGGEAWHRATPGFESPIRENRERILALMEDAGWKRTSTEWWHYSYRVPGAGIAEKEWTCKPESM